MKILKQHRNHSKNKFIRIEYEIFEAEKLQLFSIDAKQIILSNIIKEDLDCFDNPKFYKDRFFVVKGKIGNKDECHSCFYDIDNEDWDYCPHCGYELDEIEEVNNVYRTIEKAQEDENYIELGISDIYVVIVEESGVENEEY